MPATAGVHSPRLMFKPLCQKRKWQQIIVPKLGLTEDSSWTILSEKATIQLREKDEAIKEFSAKNVNTMIEIKKINKKFIGKFTE